MAQPGSARALGARGRRFESGRPDGPLISTEKDSHRPLRIPTGDRPWKEPSGTIVHGLLASHDAERRVILWNTVPTHPHEPGDPFSNRRPTRAEVEAGLLLTRSLLLALGPDRLVVAVGVVAAVGLGGLAQHVVRHPANAGATRFRREMAALLQ